MTTTLFIRTICDYVASASGKTIRVRRERLAERFGPREPQAVVRGASFFKYYLDIDKCLLGLIVSHDEEQGTHNMY